MSPKEKPRRRFGRIRQLPSGRWQARYPGPDGLLRAAPHTFEREGDADSFLSEVETDMRRGNWFDPLAGRIPLGKYAAVWIEERDLSTRTVELYRGLLRNHIEPHLGSVDLADLDSPGVRRWRKELRDKGTSVGVMAKSYRLLHAVMETAVLDGSAKTNPCNIKGAGTYEPDERPTATLEQVFELADVIQTRYRLVVLLATFTSLRYGEIMGLRRRNLDLNQLRVRIAKAAIQTDDGRTIDGDPKARSRRTLSLPEFLVAEIEAHLKQFVGNSPNAIVFLGPKGARLTRANFHRVWNKARTKVGLPDLHLHDLRHTGNTYAAETGATLRELMNRMGHRSTRAALIYLHARDQRDKQIADGLNDMVTKLREPASDNPEGHAGGTTDESGQSQDRE